MLRVLARHAARHLTLALLLPALVLRALVPVGFMPGGSADAVLALQMCSASGPVAFGLVPVDRDAVLRVFDPGEQAPLRHGEDRHSACDFALAAQSSAPPPSPATLVLAQLGREPRPSPVRDRASVPRIPEHAQQPRAPPRYS